MSDLPECEVFGVGSRKWRICRHEAGLPPQKMDSYRVQWGLSPLLSESPEEIREEHSPELVFHGASVSEASESDGNLTYGPGTELIAIYKAAGVPTCDACLELALRMNNWGVEECRKRIDDVVSDILPRAIEWLRENHPWAMRLIPDALGTKAVSAKIKADIARAIDTSEATMSDRKAKRLNVFTGRKSSGCSSCSGGKQSASVDIHKTNSARFSRKPMLIPLEGRPINRERLKSHILYHIMPLAGDTEWVWRRHCQWLRDVRHQFNGRLIIGIVTPGPGDVWQYFPPEAVKEELKGLGAEFIEAPNDTGRGRTRGKVRQGIGEGVLFPQMLGMLNTSDPDEIAYYGHCKGVTRQNTQRDGVVNLWAEAMFDTLFRNQDSVVTALNNSGVCGPFRMHGGYRDGGPGIGSKWFFSGTFFATRLVDVFRRDWSYIPHHYGCVEQWPRLNFDRDTQSACLFFDKALNLYDENYWKTTVSPSLDKWRTAHGTSRTA